MMAYAIEFVEGCLALHCRVLGCFSFASSSLWRFETLVFGVVVVVVAGLRVNDSPSLETVYNLLTFQAGLE